MKISCIFLFACLAAGCVSANHAPKPGQLTVYNIPENYINGIILVLGNNKNGETFRYSPKILQKITAATVEIKLYTKAAAVQEPFTGSGEYSVTVSLFESNTGAGETRLFLQQFTGGGAAVNWNDGDIKEELEKEN